MSHSNLRRLAQEQLNRRIATELLAGEQLGPAPLLVLIMRALFGVLTTTVMSPWPKPVLLHAVRGKRAHHSYWLTGNLSAVLERRVGGDRRVYSATDAAFVLYKLVRRDPIAAEKLLMEIGRAVAVKGGDPALFRALVVGALSISQKHGPSRGT